MKERGMIFNGEMVRAILDGRKTQTRRVVKFKPREPGLNLNFSGLKLSHYCTGDASSGYVLASRGAMGCWNDKTYPAHCPYGQPGDRIWVRETFQGPLFDYDHMNAYNEDKSKFEKPEFCVYKADGKPAPEFFDADDNLHCCWRPSIHMPRWASRILLEITDVRVERLNSISEADAAREGLIKLPATGRYCINQGDQYFGGASHDAREVFSWLWKSIYGDDSWQANPWVWVIKFKRIEGAAQ